MRERNNRKKYREQILKKRRIAALTKLFICAFAIVVVCSGFATKASQPVESLKYYKEVRVGNGDTLWDIATEHVSDEYNSVSEYINEIRKLNSIQEDEIFYGQCLMIPYYSK